MGLKLIIIPDPPASTREHGSDRQQPGHLPGLEDAPLRVDQRNPPAVELEPCREVGGVENPVVHGSEPLHMGEGCLAQLDIVVGISHRGATIENRQSAVGRAQLVMYHYSRKGSRPLC
jgi:hypothetical protein